MSARNFTKTYDGKIFFELFEGEIIYTSETFEACGKTDYEFLKDKFNSKQLMYRFLFSPKSRCEQHKKSKQL